MSEEYFQHTVDVVVRKDSELYEKMCDIAELSGMPIETVADLLAKVGLAIHMRENADVHLRMHRQQKTPLGKRDDEE